MDRVDAAIAATQQPKPEQRAEFKVRLQSGRIVALNVPHHLSGQEAIDLIGYIALQLPVELAKLQQQGPALLVPTHAIPRA